MPATATADRHGIGGNNPPSLIELPDPAKLKEKHLATFDKARKWVRRAKDASLEPKTEAECDKLLELYAEGRDIANDLDSLREQEKKPFWDAGKLVDATFNEAITAIGADLKKGGLAADLNRAGARVKAALIQAEQKRLADEAEAARKRADELAQKAAKQDDRGQHRQADQTYAQADGLDAHATALEADATRSVADASRGRTAGGRAASVNVTRTCTAVAKADLDLEALRPFLKEADLIDAVNRGLKAGMFTSLKGAAIIEQAAGRVR